MFGFKRETNEDKIGRHLKEGIAKALKVDNDVVVVLEALAIKTSQLLCIFYKRESVIEVTEAFSEMLEGFVDNYIENTKDEEEEKSNGS